MTDFTSKHVTDSSDNEQDFDKGLWSVRTLQRELLRKAQLPKLGEVSPGVAKSILFRIDDRSAGSGICTASARTLSLDSCFDQRTVERSLAAITCAGLVFRHPKRHRTDRVVYEILWEALARLVPAELLTKLRDCSSRQTLKWLDSTTDGATVATDRSPVVATDSVSVVDGGTTDRSPLTTDRSPDISGREAEDSIKRKITKRKESGSNRASALSENDIDPYLFEIVSWWNELKHAGLVTSATTVNSAVQSAWKRVRRDELLLAKFQDLRVLRAKIEASGFLRDKPWFALTKLLGGKTKDHEYFVNNLLEGRYASTSSPQKTANVGAGVNFKGTGTVEAW